MNGFYFEEVTGSHKLSPKCGLPQSQHLASSSEPLDGFGTETCQVLGPRQLSF